jgi:tyrosyl-tRNA synthetase
VQRASEVLFGGTSYEDLSKDDFEVLKSELTFAQGDSQPIIDILVANGLAKSKTEARQFLESNAIYINGQQIPLNKTTIDASDAISGYVIIRRGKNQQMLYKINQ